MVFLDNINNSVDSPIIDFAVKSTLCMCAKGLVPGSLTRVAMGDQSWQILRVSRIPDKQTIALELDRHTSTSCNSSFIFINSAMTSQTETPHMLDCLLSIYTAHSISRTSSSRNESASRWSSPDDPSLISQPPRHQDHPLAPCNSSAGPPGIPARADPIERRSCPGSSGLAGPRRSSDLLGSPLSCLPSLSVATGMQLTRCS